MHEAKLAKMEAEMKMVFQQKVQEKEAKLKQSEDELYARHREMKEALEKQRMDLEDKKRRIESGRPLTPDKTNVSCGVPDTVPCADVTCYKDQGEEGFPPCLILPFSCYSPLVLRYRLLTLWYPRLALVLYHRSIPAIVHLRATMFCTLCFNFAFLVHFEHLTTLLTMDTEIFLY